MSSGGFIHPLRRDGTSQRQRALPALAPESVPVDERDLEHHLLYLRRYSRLLRYTTPENLPGGDWLELIDGDPTLQVAEIATADLDALREIGDRAFAGLLGTIAGGPSNAQLTTAFDLQLGPIYALVKNLDRLHRRAEPRLGLRATLERMIRSITADALRGALAVALRARDVGLAVSLLETTGLGAVWALDGVAADPGYLPSGSPVQLDEARTAGVRLHELHRRMTEGLAALRESAPELLRESLERWPSHPPHMALLLAFLDVFSHARDQINTLGRKHLDFYYRRVLGLEPRGAVPDQAHVVFDLAKNADAHRLESGVELKAGKDETGVARQYATDGELILRRTALDADGLKNVYIDRDGEGTIRNIYAAPDADSADGRGAPLDEEGKWPAFGSTGMPFAELGFAVASSMFLLAEGTRTITLTFELVTGLTSNPNRPRIEKELAANIDVQATGAEGWIDVRVEQVSFGTDDLVFTLALDAGEPAVVPYDAKKHGGEYTTSQPLLRFLLDNEGLAYTTLQALELAAAKQELGDGADGGDAPAGFRTRQPKPSGGLPEARRRIVDIAETGLERLGPEHLVRVGGRLFLPLETLSVEHLAFDHALLRAAELSYPYEYLENVLVEGLHIHVDVKGLRTLILESDVGLLEPAKPFMPFGPSPKRGGSFLVGSYEVFHKPLRSVDLHITWADLPQENFKDHYEQYKDDDDHVLVSGNDHFKTAVQLLDGGVWQDALEEVQLFDDPGATDPPAAARLLELDGALERDVKLEPFSRYDPSLRRGFLRLRLDQSFLHELHGLVMAKAVVGPDPDPSQIPNPPYTPLIATLELDYTASLAVSKQDLEHGRESLLQLGPFGHLAATPLRQVGDPVEGQLERHLLPQFPVGGTGDELARGAQAEGTLFIGLQHARPPEVLSMLVQVAEGSEDPSVEPTPIAWSYLAGERWVDFETAEVLADGTRGLLQSGIVRLSLPEAMTAASSLLPAGRHWLKASVATGSAGVAKLIAVHPQAAVASFEDQGNDPRHLEKPLAAGSIDRLLKRRAQVKKAAQPYASFGGRPREADAAFDTRASERLRHRGRAVAIWDYERLVLERFPDVYKVRCLSHSREGCEHAPGHVRLVVLPDLRNKNAVDPLEPRLSRARLRQIEDELRPLASDFAQVTVTNPDYEQVKVAFDVRFTAGQDDGFASRRLEQEIIGFLSPWLYDDAADLALGGRIHRSQVLEFVENRDYVDFVRDFQLDHQVAAGSWQEDVIEAVATRSSVALVSYEQHDVRPGAASCVDELGTTAPGDRYLGNKHTHELHDLRCIQVNCQLDEIVLDRRVAFASLQDALDEDYDLCAYCFGRERSSR